MLRAAIACCCILIVMPLSAARAAGDSSPWYDRASCKEAMQIVMALDLDGSESAIRTLETDKDLDAKACGVYLRALLSEMLIAVHGSTPEQLRYREEHLKRMFGFAKAHAKYGVRYADLEVEARMRRVRTLFEQGNKTEALAEARRANKLLKARLERGTSPTVDFVQGIMYSALGQSGMLTRTLLGMAGLSGDPAEGYQALQRVYGGHSVYRDEALYLARHFAWDMRESGSPFGDPLALGRTLVARHPTNGQFVYDQGRSLRLEGQCKEAMEIAQPIVRRIEENPGVWAPNLRSKTFFLAGRCLVELGQLERAKELREAMARQPKSDFSENLAALDDAIREAGGAR
ncbi:MAG: hypothetical protein HC923_02590 [Myxococcales bacterium]|nr:hypothetical protein [Myxococcales bacterium]